MTTPRPRPALIASLPAGDDPRWATVQARLQIGFPEGPGDWEEAEERASADALQICGHPVMEAWEDPYMRALAAVACRRGGRVLEVGFGMGISAGWVQTHAIDEHVIIEANRAVFARLQGFAGQATRPVRALLGGWQEVCAALPAGSFDGILFDTYPITADEIHGNHFPFFPVARRLLRPGGVFTYYSDEIDHLSEPHLARLRAAGFSEIGWEVCPVAPPPGCLYWQSPTIVVPIVAR
jgi:guanidinoacetate N-methyltransferase